jgi:general secretion pathway protein C
MQSRSWEERQQIVDRNLFHSSVIAASVAAPVPDDEQLEETELPLKLWGTIASDNAELAWASIEEIATKTSSAFRVGDQIQNATVIGIERRRVVLLENGNRRALTLDDDTVSSSARAPRVASSTARARERPSRRTTSRTTRTSRRDRLRQKQFAAEVQSEVEQQDVKDLSSNPAALYSQARILPKVDQDGQVEGLEISAIKPGSVFEEAGIREGEVITEIDGVPISDLGKSTQIMSALTGQGTVDLTLETPDAPPRSLPFTAQ